MVFDTDPDNSLLTYNATVPQLFLTAINAGIIRNVLRDAINLVHKRPRTFYHSTAERAADDPLIQQTVGQIAANAFAAEAIVLCAADGLDDIITARAKGKDESAASLEASLRASKAKLVVDELTLRSTTLLFEVGGASTTKKAYNFDRHWRNARTLSSHNPASLKARAIGNYEINGTPLPTAAFFKAEAPLTRVEFREAKEALNLASFRYCYHINYPVISAVARPEKSFWEIKLLSHYLKSP